MMLTLRLILALACVLGPAGPVLAQDDPISAVFPEVKKLSAPAWVSEGTRLTYYVSSASVPEDRHLYYRDEQGGFVDQYGNRYREDEATGTGGHEYLQVGVAALHGGQAVLDQRTFGFLGTQGVMIPSTRYATSCYVGGNESWVNPKFLNSLAEVGRGGLKIQRTPYTLGGKTYKAVRIHYSNDRGYYAYVYDLDSGVLLYWGTATSGRPQASFSAPGTPGRTGLLAQGILVSVRRAAPPWASAESPALLRTLGSLSYAGTTTLQGGYSYPVRLDMRVLSRGSRHAVLRVVRTQNPGPVPSPPTESTTVSAAAQVGGMWLPPAAIPGLKAGQLVDEDPVTSVRVTVVGPTRGPDGRPLLQIREAADSFVTDHYYDCESGLLAYYTFWEAGLKSRLQLQLVSAQ